MLRKEVAILPGIESLPFLEGSARQGGYGCGPAPNGAHKKAPD